jgi:hypothetical protein
VLRSHGLETFLAFEKAPVGRIRSQGLWDLTRPQNDALGDLASSTGTGEHLVQGLQSVWEMEDNNVFDLFVVNTQSECESTDQDINLAIREAFFSLLSNGLYHICCVDAQSEAFFLQLGGDFGHMPGRVRKDNDW